MKKNVCFLYGINGVGKSMLAKRIIEAVPGAVQVSGSDLLRRALGAATREELEHMNSAEKRAALFDAFRDFCALERSRPLIVCDTHLTVALRNNGAVTYEYMWDDRYLDYGAVFVNVVASSKTILQRRLNDERQIGRKRCADPAAIEGDIRVNDEAFRVLQAVVGSRGFVLNNCGSAVLASRRLLKAVRCTVRQHAA